MFLRSLASGRGNFVKIVPVSRAEVTGRLSLPDATSAHAREIVGSFGPQ